MNSNFITDAEGNLLDKAEYKHHKKNTYGKTKQYYENLEKFKQGVLNKNDRRRRFKKNC